MDFIIGTYVKFIDDVGGGFVIKIIDSETVLIKLEEGFEVEAKIRSLVADHSRSKTNIPESKKEVQETTIVKKEQIKIDNSVDKVVSAGNTNLELHFIEAKRGFDMIIKNGQGLKAKVCLFSNSDNKYSLLNEIEIFSASYKEIGSFNPGSCSNLIAEVIWLEGEGNFKRPPVSTQIKIKTSRFYKSNSFKYCSWLDEKSICEIIYQEENIFDNVDFSNHAQFKSETVKGPKYSKSHKRISQTEIDIHIEELVDDYRGLSNGEIVNIQLKAVQNKIEECLSARIKELVIIHGRGSGVLRSEVRRLISSYGLNYSDGSFQKYGAGATLVEFTS